MPWAVRHRSVNALDGDRSWLEGTTLHPCRRIVFETREEARDYIRVRHGYIAKRPDLRREPHGMKMPVAVRVRITVTEESA
jgi:hypothetical protein